MRSSTPDHYRNTYQGIHPWIIKIIHAQAASLAGRYGFTESDTPDIEQVLHLAVCEGLPKAPLGIPFEAAVYRIVKSKATDLIRYQKRECRDYRRESFSLNSPLPGSDDADTQMGDVLDPQSSLEWAYGSPPAWHSIREEMADEKELLEKLTDEDKAMAEALIESEGNLSEAARMMGHTLKKMRVGRERIQRTIDSKDRANPSGACRSRGVKDENPLPSLEKTRRNPQCPARHNHLRRTTGPRMAGDADWLAS